MTDRCPVFSNLTRVYWEDTDAGGVVYHASYVRFFERARTEWLRHRGIGQAALRDQDDCVLVVRAMEVDFLRPARLDDLLEVSVRVARLKGASLVIAQSITRGDEVLATATVRVACIGATDFRPRPLPPGFPTE